MHAGATMWEDKSGSSLPFTLSPAINATFVPRQQTEGRLLKSFVRGFWEALLRRGRESHTAVYFPLCCGIQISADAIHSTS